MATADRIRPVLEEGLAGGELVLEDVTVTPAGRRRVVRVLLDRDLGDVESVSTPTPPLSLDEVAAATRVVEDALEASGVLGESPYTLEVSSAGVGRPLTAPRHFQRNVGRLVTVATAGGERTGRLTAADRRGVTLEPAGGVPETLAYADVDRASVQVEFSRPDDEKES
ncbi:ribosome maturation factor RimP [Phycicoccus endophyticus]|uniref:Ribosome maturation factor RimP n=1 Tax=Phycicoccus endophyticus TaxID=1690220 RepID=A0A7G9R5D7_9MICO|nr:ribosome maturation factor RimP [Phycicoccus endophyticus]NHI19149.1 ribosome maturation factor RimP [Phycicoccus endophyticus]QNN50812.1 ribosome maturation factor RimP [Phycicoccus endophyticus]GGL40523.1 ribosome maturation factor RimP [Phycicoccus endophyticus]